MPFADDGLLLGVRGPLLTVSQTARGDGAPTRASRPRSSGGSDTSRVVVIVASVLLVMLLMLVRPIQGLVSTMSTTRRSCHHIAVIGGGASGMFAAIAAARQGDNRASPAVSVTVLEATAHTLAKVKISGGGRCNVLHDTSKTVPELLAGYPRGRRELQGLLHKGFSPTQAQEWFEAQGVTLKTEADGRMFPTSDNSQSVIHALHEAAADAGVSLRLRCKVQSLAPRSDGRWDVHLTQKDKAAKDPTTAVSDNGTTEEVFDAVILATGSAPVGYQLAEKVGHTLVPTVPSLFTLNTRHELRDGGQGRFHDLSGISVPWARITFQVAPLVVAGQQKKKKRSLSEEGPLLITHHGLSGPAALRLSAFGAREWHAVQYQGNVTVHWAPHLGTANDIFDQLWGLTTLRPKKTVASVCPLLAVATTVQRGEDAATSALPRRLWASLCAAAGVTSEQVWGTVPKKTVRKLALQISECVVAVTSKGRFKEEFVTAGGVALKEIDMKTMQSKVCPGLFLCGEVIDVDGVTGGFNFMNCWGTGHVAGTNAADHVRASAREARV